MVKILKFIKCELTKMSFFYRISELTFMGHDGIFNCVSRAWGIFVVLLIIEFIYCTVCVFNTANKKSGTSNVNFEHFNSQL